MVEGDLFESVPNFSEGRREEVIASIAAAADRAFVLDVDPDTDHNRVVVSLAGRSRRIIDGLMGAVSVAVERIDLPSHRGVHPRGGVADVVPLVPLGSTSLDSCRELADPGGGGGWGALRVLVVFTGQGGGR